MREHTTENAAAQYRTLAGLPEDPVHVDDEQPEAPEVDEQSEGKPAKKSAAKKSAAKKG